MKYVFDKDKNLFEAWDKEEVIAAIVNYLETHAVGDVDTGFVTTIKEQNADKGLKFWVGTTAQYNAIVTKDADTLYILSDDTELTDIEAVANQAYSSVMEIADKKGAILLNQTVAYNWGSTVAVDLLGVIEDYEIVKVATQFTEALCNVRKGENYINVQGITCQTMSSENGVAYVVVNVTVDRQTNKITSNRTVTMILQTGGTPTISGTAITKITGVY